MTVKIKSLVSVPVCVLLTLAATLAGVVHTTPAHAANPPEWGLSWYFTNGTSDAYDRGCTLGNEARNTSGRQDYVVVLAFGAMINAPNGFKFGQWSHNPITDDEAKQRIQQYAKGFYFCSDTDTDSFLRIAMGTNNDSGAVGPLAGKAMANRVDEANSWLDNNNYDSQTGAFGANDIELGYGPPGEARDWVDGYNNNTSTAFYNTGDAAGCSTTDPAGSECGTATYPGWGANDVWYVSDFANAIPLPQIYTSSESMAKQWKWLSIYAYQHQNGRMNIRGSATQHAACAQAGGCSGVNNTVSEGWNQLKEKLQSDNRSDQPTASLLATDWKWTDA